MVLRWSATISLTIGARSHGTCRNSSLSACKREISSKSLTMRFWTFVCRSARSSIICTSSNMLLNTSLFAGTSFKLVLRRSLANWTFPLIVVRGVLSSWLMMPRNSSMRRLASRKASSFARAFSCSRCIRSRSVISRFISRIAVGRPDSSFKSTWRLSTITCVPSRREWVSCPSHCPCSASRLLVTSREWGKCVWSNSWDTCPKASCSVQP